MNITLVAFGIAREILGKPSMDYQVEQGQTLLQLKERLASDYPRFQRLRSLKLAVNEDYQSDDFALKEGDEVVIIPPVSGG